jgi:hypothetical protein
MTSTEEEFVQAEDLESLQGLFSSCCDGEGLMTKAEVMQIPSISELLVCIRKEKLRHKENPSL